MAMVALVLPEGVDATIGPLAATRLAQLGVVNVTLLRDGATVVVVLQGWALEPQRGDPVIDAVGVPGSRVLLPVLEMAVHAASDHGEGR